MADSVAGSYASLAGIEIVNDARTIAYLQRGLAPGNITVTGDCSCPNLRQLIGCDDNAYRNPEADEAPWFTASIPESADFAGFIMTEFTGMDSPFTRSVKEGVGNGGTLTRSRLKTRSMTWKGFLFGATCCATLYGYRWLTRTLSRFDSSCRDCAGDDLEILICCPDEGETRSPFRTLKGVALLDGPHIVSERKTCQSGCNIGCGGSCILEIEFTLVAEQPYFYSPEIPVYDCISISEGAVVPYTDATEECGPFDCSDTFFTNGEAGISIGFDCVAPILPPTATYVNNCVVDFVTPRANYYSVQRELWSELEEVVPVISITTGALPVSRIKLGFYTSANGNPCSELSLYPPDCDVVCDELNILFIPAYSTFYIDSRTRKMALICKDGSAYPGERMTSGPWSWPSFDCYGFCLEVMYENDVPTSGVSPVAIKDTCFSLSLVPRSF